MPDYAKRYFEVRVYYEDTDFSGYVYHANYLKYVERARSEYLREIGVKQNALFADGLTFVVRRMDCEFLRPAKFQDVLQVETQPLDMRGARFEMMQTVKRGDEILFTASVTVALIDGRGKPKRATPEMIALFLQGA